MSMQRRTYTKTCEVCGSTFERQRYANGALQNSVEWGNRRTCTEKCRNELRRRTYHDIVNARHGAYQHPPCTHCGKPVTPYKGEGRKHWRQRVTCSQACRTARRSLSRGNPATLMRGSKGRKRKAKLANDGYVFNGKFPTPPGVTNWVSVSGPDTGVTITTRHNSVTKSSATVAMLRSAVRAHPELGTALLGQLSDSWVQQDAATYHG